MHIPVLMTQTGLKELVYNDFISERTVMSRFVAGCGIHNGGDQASEHSGIHSFFIGKNAKVRYVEKHYGSGEGTGERVMNPQTIVSMEEDSYLEMDTVQIRGVDSTDRVTRANLGKGAQLVIREKLMTHGKQKAATHFYVDLDGEDSSTNVISRSVAKDSSEQTFYSPYQREQQVRRAL